MSIESKKIGLVGVGNMGSAILEGLLDRRLVSSSQVFVYDKFADKAGIFAQERGVSLASSVAELVQSADIVILAIKPQDLQTAADEMKPCLSREKTIISILAGSDLNKLKSAFGSDVVLVRAMPNLGAKVAQSLTALTCESDEALADAEEVFSGCGKTLRLSEEHFDLFTALCGSGPAYFFLLMETIEEKALAAGLDKTTAGLIASQTALGAALTAQASHNSAGELREMVTSKGGTTAAALQVLDDGLVRQIYSDAYDAATKRSVELREG